MSERYKIIVDYVKDEKFPVSVIDTQNDNKEIEGYKARFLQDAIDHCIRLNNVLEKQTDYPDFVAHGLYDPI